jgi:hypothetical protein
VLPSGDTGAGPPHEEDENEELVANGGDDQAAAAAATAKDEMDVEEEELSPLRALQDVETGLDAFPPLEEDDDDDDDDDAGDLDATRTRGRRHPSSRPSPIPRIPGMAAAAPPPPLFPPIAKHGWATTAGAGAGPATHFFLPPALATATPLSAKQAPILPPTAAATTPVAGGGKRKMGTKHVFWASAETMWGVLIFLRFGWCVGQVGLVPTLGAVLLSAACQSLCASSLSAVATNGLVTRSGGKREITCACTITQTQASNPDQITQTQTQAPI